MKKLLTFFLFSILILMFFTGCGKVKPTITCDIEPSLKKVQLELADENKIIFSAMGKEIHRSIEGLKLDDESPKVYYISHLLEDNFSISFSYTLGSEMGESQSNRRNIFTSVRVGDHKMDKYINTAEKSVYNPEMQKYSQITSGMVIPLEDDELVLRKNLWLLTDVAYKKALTQYSKKKSRKKTEVERKEDEGIYDFTKEEKKDLISKTLTLEIDKEKVQKMIKELSEVMREYNFLDSSSIDFNCKVSNKYFYDSEGRKIQFGLQYCTLHCQLETKAPDGMNLNNDLVITAENPDEFPPIDELKNMIKHKCKILKELRTAKIIEPFSGPVMIKSPASGVFFHEVLGHRLEAHRVRSVKEAETLRNKVGEVIINEHLTIFDDPTIKYFNKQYLLGYYPADDEGIISMRANLIEKGVLKGFLMSRLPIKGFDKSNAHGRGSLTFLKYRGQIVPRQGNLVIVPDKAYSEEDLLKLLEKEIKKQKKEFGLIVESTTGGFTVTNRFDLQHFMVKPVVVYKYYPGGKKELVRGTEFGGTPLISFEKIIGFGDDFKVFNGFCGAESGYVPVSSIAPTIIISELEIQKSSRSVKKPKILPSPIKKNK